MKTAIFGAIMGLSGAVAVYVSIALGWSAWVLFMAWVCYYFYGKSTKKSFQVYVEIVLGIALSVLIELLGGFLSTYIGNLGTYLAIFLLIGSLAFLIKIKGLQDLTAWFVGLVVFYGVEPSLDLFSMVKLLLLPLAAGFILGYVMDSIVVKYVHGVTASPANH